MMSDDATSTEISLAPTSIEPSSDFPLVVSVLPRRAGWRRRRGSAPIDVSALVRVMPEIAQALRSGEMVRIVGPSALLEGIRDGTLRYLPGEVGHYGTVIDQHGRIAGQV